MKKVSILLSLVCSLSMISAAQAKTKKATAASGSHEGYTVPTAHGSTSERYGLSGCGLGSILFKEPKNKVHQVFASTTNSSSGTQTFGISTGTLNCEVDGVVAQRAEQEVFVNANYDTLSHEVAAGSGETLVSMAFLMGCPKNQAATFAKMSQKHYQDIFANTSSENVGQVVRGFRSMISRDNQLSKACSTVASL